MTPPHAPPAPGFFVGRTRELTALGQGLDEARSGRGGIVLLEGDPGIGKTRIAEHFSQLAGRADAIALLGRCHEGAGAPAFWPWIQALRAYVADRDPEELRTDLGRGAADVATLIELVHERLPGLPPAPRLEPVQARFRLFDSLSAFLGNVGRRRALLLILDDLHWADRPSLLLLEFLAREIRRHHALIVGCYRGLEIGPTHPLGRTLAQLAREGVANQLVVEGLSRTELGEYVQLTAGVQLPDDVLSAVHARTRGNPFFAGQAVRLMAAEGKIRPGVMGELTLPPSAREAVSRRLRRLPASSRQILAVAAVIGREFTLRALAGAVDRPASVLLRDLDNAIGARVVTESGGVGRYRFVHALVREVLYESLGPSARAELHRRVGEAVERLPVPDRADRLAELAYHFCQSARLGDADRAVTYAVLAAERAAALLAYEEAARHYQMALGALELIEPPDPGRACELLLALGESQARAGDTPAARETYQAAARLAGVREDHEALVKAALGFAGEVVTGGIVDAEAVGLLRTALAVVPEADAGLRARLLGRLAMERYYEPVREPADELSQEALSLARACRDPAALAYALNARRYASWGPDNLRERLSLGAELVRRSAGSPELALQGYRWRIPDLAEVGDRPMLDVELAELERRATEVRQPLYIWYAAVFRTMVALVEGRLDEAERLSGHALALGRRAQSGPAEIYYAAHRYTLCLERGRPAEAETVLVEIHRRYRLPLFRCWLANLQVRIGRPDAARGTLDELAASGLAALRRDALWLGAAVALGEVCVELGATSTGAEIYTRLLPYAGRNVMVGVPVCHGPVAHYLGRLAAAVGDPARARRHHAQASAMNARMRAAGWAVHTHRALDELDARTPVKRPAGLTVREVEVLRLLAGGATSPEMAAQLSISVHTVETHLAHVYAKLGARGRVEATAFAVRHGLTPE